MITETDIKICHLCGKLLEGGYSCTIVNDKETDFLCDDCDLKRRLKDYEQNGELSTSLTTTAYIREYRNDNDQFKKIRNSANNINEKIKEFEKKIWFTSTQKYIQNAKLKGHSGKTKHTKILLWACAGRVAITINDTEPKGEGKFDGAYITTMCAEDSSNSSMGLHGLCATEKEAISLIDYTIENWPELIPDEKVNMGF